MTLALDDIQDEFLSNGRICDSNTEYDQYLSLVQRYRLEAAFRIACMKRFRTPHYSTLSDEQWEALARGFRPTLQQAVVRGTRPSVTGAIALSPSASPPPIDGWRRPDKGSMLSS